MKKLALLLAIALLALPASALADVKKGDRGEEVRYLQWLLVSTGYLAEEPDGAFGGHTEQAVMDSQQSKGLEPTGIATYGLMEALEADRAGQDRALNGESYYAPYDGDFTPPFITGEAATYVGPAHCRTSMTPTLAWRDPCQRHQALLVRESELSRRDDASELSEACALWLNDIEAAFDDLSARFPDAQADIQAARTGWSEAFEAQRQAMLVLWEDGPFVQRALTRMARNYALALCELASGEPVARADIAVGDDSSAKFDPSCRQWLQGAGTEYTACCEDHADLFELECGWMELGAEDAQSLAFIANYWELALQQQYNAWLNRCGEADASAVTRACEAGFQALSSLGAALAPACGSPELARLRATEFECARLCQMLGEKF